MGRWRLRSFPLPSAASASLCRRRSAAGGKTPVYSKETAGAPRAAVASYLATPISLFLAKVTAARGRGAASVARVPHPELRGARHGTFHKRRHDSAVLCGIAVSRVSCVRLLSCVSAACSPFTPTERDLQHSRLPNWEAIPTAHACLGGREGGAHRPRRADAGVRLAHPGHSFPGHSLKSAA